MYLVKSITFAGFLLAAIPNRSMSNLKSSLGYPSPIFATMSSDELKKDKYHQRKISFTALVFLYYIIVLKAPT